MESRIVDIHPNSKISVLGRDYSKSQLDKRFDRELVAALVGMSTTFVEKIVKSKEKKYSLRDTLILLDQDSFSETFVPRSLIPQFLLNLNDAGSQEETIELRDGHNLIPGNAKDLITKIPNDSLNCVVTSTPYWGMRVYERHFEVEWGDGEKCAFGHEQTPEAFIRHTIEILFLLKNKMRKDGSIWWNLMDTFNTRTQIRSSAAETLEAMKGNDARGWKDHDCRRYSAGHSYLSDGEQCSIPNQVAHRASRIGYLLKGQITWKKLGSMPETVKTRVSREAEYIIHLSLQRSPYFNKSEFKKLPPELGGRNMDHEYDKVTDVWCLATSTGTGGHGAQFPISLPGRCIGLSTRPGDWILDPFVGSGNTSIAAKKLGRNSLGFDISDAYLEAAHEKLNSEN